MHYNKNHDKLGRFAKGRGGSISGNNKKQSINQRQRLSKYSNDDLVKKANRLELENRYLNAEKKNSSFEKLQESGSKKVLKTLGKIGGKTLSAVASGVGMVLAVGMLEKYGILRNSNDKAIFLKFIK